jgi:protein-disulfide isomerase
MIRADHQRGVQVGVGSTPTILVDDVRLDGNAPIEAIRKAMAQVRARASQGR